MSEAVLAGGFEVPRRTRPKCVSTGPCLVGFGDGAFPAFCGVVYVVWQHACIDPEACDEHVSGDIESSFSSHFVIGKARVTPLRGYTIPHSKICGAVIASRLLLRVAKSLQTLDKPPVSSILLLDSECTISCLEARSSMLKPFFHNRRDFGQP